MIWAIVGAGGKTTLIHEMAQAYLAQGLSVFVTTTTHMFIEEDTLAQPDAQAIVCELKRKRYVMAGVREGEKIAALPKAVYEQVCAQADVTLVEADGSKQLPVKFPAEHEPVVPDNADGIIVVCGLHAIGRRMGDAAHRVERVKACLNASEETILEAAHIQRLVMCGYVEPLSQRYPDKRIRIYAAHDGSLYQRAAAALIEAQEDVSQIKAEWFAPQPNLMICGGGHIALELSRMASLLDFRVTVLDDRQEFASKTRFAQADEVICDSFDHLERYLVPDGYYVVATRGHEKDYECVRTLLAHSNRYLGMIGSRAKVKATFDALARDGFEAVSERVHAPIGLNIGAVTPAEIAVSILAEIIREKNRTGAVYSPRELLNSREVGVLCVITRKSGSGPRGEGSMMLVGENGIIGSIGGGAIEHAAACEARGVRQVTSREYHLSNQDSAKLGMICGGTCSVLMIPLYEYRSSIKAGASGAKR